MLDTINFSFPTMFSKDLLHSVFKGRDCVDNSISCFQHYFGYIAAVKAPAHAFLKFFMPVLHTIFLPCHWLLSNMTIAETIDNGSTGMNSVAMTITNPLTECLLSWELNQGPLVLKSCTLRTETWRPV